MSTTKKYNKRYISLVCVGILATHASMAFADTTTGETADSNIVAAALVVPQNATSENGITPVVASQPTSTPTEMTPEIVVSTENAMTVETMPTIATGEVLLATAAIEKAPGTGENTAAPAADNLTEALPSDKAPTEVDIEALKEEIIATIIREADQKRAEVDDPDEDPETRATNIQQVEKAKEIYTGAVSTPVMTEVDPIKAVLTNFRERIATIQLSPAAKQKKLDRKVEEIKQEMAGLKYLTDENRAHYEAELKTVTDEPDLASVFENIKNTNRSNFVQKGEKVISDILKTVDELNALPRLPKNDDYAIQKEIWEESSEGIYAGKIKKFRNYAQEGKQLKELEEEFKELTYYFVHASIEKMARETLAYREKYQDSKLDDMVRKAFKQEEFNQYSSLDYDNTVLYFEREVLPQYKEILKYVNELEEKRKAEEAEKQKEAPVPPAAEEMTEQDMPKAEDMPSPPAVEEKKQEDTPMPPAKQEPKTKEETPNPPAAEENKEQDMPKVEDMPNPPAVEEKKQEDAPMPPAAEEMTEQDMPKDEGMTTPPAIEEKKQEDAPMPPAKEEPKAKEETPNPPSAEEKKEQDMPKAEDMPNPPAEEEPKAKEEAPNPPAAEENKEQDMPKAEDMPNPPAEEEPNESPNIKKVLPEVAPQSSEKPMLIISEEKVAFETQVIDNPNLPKGTEIIVQKGKDGLVLIGRANGELVQQEQLHAPVPQIIHRGTGNAKVADNTTNTAKEKKKMSTSQLPNSQANTNRPVLPRTGEETKNLSLLGWVTMMTAFLAQFILKFKKAKEEDTK